MQKDCTDVILYSCLVTSGVWICLLVFCLVVLRKSNRCICQRTSCCFNRITCCTYPSDTRDSSNQTTIVSNAKPNECNISERNISVQHTPRKQVNDKFSSNTEIIARNMDLASVNYNQTPVSRTGYTVTPHTGSDQAGRISPIDENVEMVHTNKSPSSKFMRYTPSSRYGQQYLSPNVNNEIAIVHENAYASPSSTGVTVSSTSAATQTNTFISHVSSVGDAYEMNDILVAILGIGNCDDGLNDLPGVEKDYCTRRMMMMMIH